MMDTEKEYKVKSLAKAIRVLECFTAEKPELGVTEISLMLGFHKSTVHNITSTFEAMGFLYQKGGSGKYSLGLKLLHFGSIINNHIGLRDFFLPYIRDIAKAVGETACVGIPHGREVLFIECAHPHAGIMGRNILGERAMMHCTGIGKAMLAFMPDHAVKAYMQQPLESETEHSLVDPLALMEDLRYTFARGYAIDNKEHECGITSIGVPVFGLDGNVVAGVCVHSSSECVDMEGIVHNAHIMQRILKPAQYKLKQ